MIEMKTENEFSEKGGKLVHGINYVDEHGYLPKMKAILKVTGNLRLIGETGTGKTTAVYKLAEDVQAILYDTGSLSSDASKWDFLASEVLKEGKTEVRDGIILSWLKDRTPNTKKILYVDGFNYAQNSITSLFESVADFRGTVWIPELGQSFERTEDHWLIISYNPAEKTGYSGTFLQNIATIRRFEGLVIDYLSIQAETNLVREVAGEYNFSRKWVELASKTRDAYRDSKLRTPLTTGNLLTYARLWKDCRMDEKEIFDISKSLFPEEEWTFYSKMFEETAKVDWKTAKGQTQSNP
jgi:MoxR-like ATPase